MLPVTFTYSLPMIPALFPAKKDPQLLMMQFLVQQFNQAIASDWVQRPVSWNALERKAYFKSILMNRTEGSFVFVDLQSAVEALMSHAPGDRALSLFLDMMKDGANFFTLDGNNRYTFIQQLISGDYKIPKGVYQVLHGDAVVEFAVGSKQSFDDLPKFVQKLINERICVCVTYTQVTYEDLSQIFLNLNSGCPPNRQEKRNAFCTPWSDWIRLMRKENNPLLVRLFGPDHKKRLVGDEFLVDAVGYSLVTDDTLGGVSQGVKDKLYYTDINDIDTTQYSIWFDEINSLVAGLDDKYVFKSAVHNYFWMLANGLTVDRLPAAVHLHYEAYNDKSVTNDEGDTFKWACGGLGAKNNQLRIRVLQEIMEAVTAIV
jgi:hypothetical protein